MAMALWRCLFHKHKGCELSLHGGGYWNSATQRHVVSECSIPCMLSEGKSYNNRELWNNDFSR